MECSVEEDCELFSSQSSSMESVQQNPLALHQETLRECSVHPWVLTTVTKGYRLQFAVKPPPFNGVIASVATGDSARVLEAEIASLLEKRALRPIMDLRALNKHLRKYKFKMLTFGALTRSIRRCDWFAAVNLKDAYFIFFVINNFLFYFFHT